MAATRQNPNLSALDPVRKGLHGRRGSDRIILAGHEKRRGAQAAKVDASGGGQRLAGLGEPLGVLAQMAFPDLGEDNGIGGLGRRGEPSRRNGVGDGDHPVLPDETGALA